MTQSQPGRVVLVVEDHDDTRELYVNLLEAEGMVTVGADSAMAAMDLTRSARFDAIVLDRGLPDMDGLDLCEKFRNQESCERTVLVVLSGHAATTDDAPCDAYLEKPVLPHQLAMVLQRLLAARS
jgi:CheY-like chemotaxis protein